EAIRLVLEAMEQLKKLDPSTFKFGPTGMEQTRTEQPGLLNRAFGLLPIEWSVAFFNFVLGDAYLAAGDLEAARIAHHNSLDSYRRLGVEEDATLPLTSLGKIAILQGNYQEARTLLEESLAIRRKNNIGWFTGISLTTLSDLARYE